MKSGRTGTLAFVTVAYRYFQSESTGSTGQSPATETDLATCALCLEEEQDIVYREPGPSLPAPQAVELPPLPERAWSRIVVPDTRLLFRFSALTFNAHRIHYDRAYAMSEEGYPGLVVHGPLTALLLMQLLRANSTGAVASFHFRSQAPLYDLAPFRLQGIASNGHVDLQAIGPDAKTAMVATAKLA